MSWKTYVPKDKQYAFKGAFMQQLITEELDYLMEKACFYGTRHRYDDYHKEKGEDACEDCLDDSDDRDTREQAEAFFERLWEETCAMTRVEKKRKIKEEESD
jgi:hypothetical protein